MYFIKLCDHKTATRYHESTGTDLQLLLVRLAYHAPSTFSRKLLDRTPLDLLVYRQYNNELDLLYTASGDTMIATIENALTKLLAAGVIANELSTLQ